MPSRLARCLLAGVLLAPVATPASARASSPTATFKLTPEALDTLAQQYRDEGLPLPPPDAPPLLLPYSTGEKDGVKTWQYVLGFRLTPGADEGHPGTFPRGHRSLGPRTARVEAGRPTAPVNPALPLPVALDKTWSYRGTYPTDIWLTAAIQCHPPGLRPAGPEILARKMPQMDPVVVHDRTMPEDRYDPAASRFLYRELAGGDPRQALARRRVEPLAQLVLEPGTDRAAAYGHLARLFAKYPGFKARNARSFWSLCASPSPRLRQAGDAGGIDRRPFGRHRHLRKPSGHRPTAWTIPT